MGDPRGHAFRLDLREANGALGDIGTLLPLGLGAIALAGLSPQMVLLGFGLFYIATGLVYRLPIPVQPMKAIAAVALLGVASPTEIALSGVLIGLVLLGLGGTGLIDRIRRLVPQSVLSGPRLGLSLA
ncbi:putative sulfate/molybdate transporter [Tritonibacter mobilis]|uniref:putative sulfate/molybdate transporter n=1 Tax=Tritonibacter mobilis TaxID=379347 RepID=UPI001CD9EB0A|nr:putative sulfate/molybdate transporter [Tritonibacter mobilis]MCA2009840.1 putative sulfate/molybdate transporter [Tritonibacter mobilis]